MAKKKEEVKMSPEVKAWVDYMKLSGLLFNPYSTAMYNINELKEDSPYYQSAKDLCDEMDISWEDMSHEDSNRVMLALLEDYYNAIQVDKDKDYVVHISIEEKKKK